MLAVLHTVILPIVTSAVHFLYYHTGRHKPTAAFLAKLVSSSIFLYEAHLRRKIPSNFNFSRVQLPISKISTISIYKENSTSTRSIHIHLPEKLLNLKCVIVFDKVKVIYKEFKVSYIESSARIRQIIKTDTVHKSAYYHKYCKKSKAKCY